MCQYCTVAFPPAAAFGAALAELAVAAPVAVATALVAAPLVVAGAALLDPVDVAAVVPAVFAPQAASKEAADTARADTPT